MVFSTRPGTPDSSSSHHATHEDRLRPEKSACWRQRRYCVRRRPHVEHRRPPVAFCRGARRRDVGLPEFPLAVAHRSTRRPHRSLFGGCGRACGPRRAPRRRPARSAPSRTATRRGSPRPAATGRGPRACSARAARSRGRRRARATAGDLLLVSTELGHRGTPPARYQPRMPVDGSYEKIAEISIEDELLRSDMPPRASRARAGQRAAESTRPSSVSSPRSRRRTRTCPPTGNPVHHRRSPPRPAQANAVERPDDRAPARPGGRMQVVRQGDPHQASRRRGVGARVAPHAVRSARRGEADAGAARARAVARHPRCAPRIRRAERDTGRRSGRARRGTPRRVGRRSPPSRTSARASAVSSRRSPGCTSPQPATALRCSSRRSCSTTACASPSRREMPSRRGSWRRFVEPHFHLPSTGRGRPPQRLLNEYRELPVRDGAHGERGRSPAARLRRDGRGQARARQQAQADVEGLGRAATGIISAICSEVLTPAATVFPGRRIRTDGPAAHQPVETPTDRAHCSRTRRRWRRRSPNAWWPSSPRW